MLRIASVILLSVFLISCSDDDSGPKYSFKDQNLQGKIGGTSWTYGDGFFDFTTLEEKPYLDVKLLIDQSEDVCTIYNFEGNYAFFYVPAAVGVYPLKELDWNASDITKNQTVTLLVNADVPENNFAQKGAIEILTISETQITGKLDARIDSDFTINGNFTVNLCVN